MTKTIIEVRNVSKVYKDRGIFSSKEDFLALEDVSLDIYESETLALVGESGCGKTTLGKLVLGILEPTKGSVSYRGQDIFTKNRKKRKDLQKNMQMVFQDPYSSLNPKLTIKSIVEEPLDSYKVIRSKDQREKKIAELLELVGLSQEYLLRYPRELSGGQRQRVGIARALAIEPEFIVCDEPTSALDVSIQSQILNLLIDIQKDRKLSFLFISHDLGVVRYIADRICVMYMGNICELGPVEEVYNNPKHPYTEYLLKSVPKIDFDQEEEEEVECVEEEAACKFYGKCSHRKDICKQEKPVKKEDDKREFYCHNPL